MDFGESNMFSLNTHTKEETKNTPSNKNNNIVNVWYSSWDATTTNSNTLHTSTTVAEGYAGGGHSHHHQQLYGGEGCHVQADPQLTCLHLGKRHYFEDVTTNGDANNATPLGNRHVCGGGGGGYVFAGNDKRARGYYGGGGGAGGGGKTAPFAMVPRCQVEDCHVTLVNAKEYHRRHRVCDMHSKAPKAVVLGLEQRFCQQCSRFHVVSEFDDSKRSCRRRLAGHNERRRKSSHLSVTRNTRQGCALSLLSSGSGSRDHHNWLSHHADFSTRCSAALRELIAENRAALMTRQQQQLVYDRVWPHIVVVPHHDADAAVEEEDFEDLQQQQPQSNYFPQQMFPQTQ